MKTTQSIPPPLPKFKGVCEGGPMHGREIEHTHVGLSLDAGFYEYCSTKPKIWLWRPSKQG